MSCKAFEVHDLVNHKFTSSCSYNPLQKAVFCCPVFVEEAIMLLGSFSPLVVNNPAVKASTPVLSLENPEESNQFHHY